MPTRTARPSCLRAILTTLALLVGLLLPAAASAQSVLEIVEIDTKSAPEVVVYFSARNSDNSPISGIKADDVSLLIDNEKPPLSNKELLPFKDGEQPVAVVVIFPVAADYIEEFFGIRTNVAAFIRQFRPLDHVGYVSYDATAQPSRMFTGADIGGAADTIMELKETEVIEPNMFTSMAPALGMLKGLDNVKLKYVVMVTNAEGAVVGDDKQATKRVQAFQSKVKELGIRPLIIGYTPDGPESLTYKRWLKQLALAGGTYSEATAIEDLPTAMNKVYDQIFQQYVLKASVDLSDPEAYWLEEGKYGFTVSAKIGSQELKSTKKAGWSPPEKPESAWWFWWIVLPLLCLFGAFLLIFIIVKIARRKKDEPVQQEMMMMQQEPQEFRCEVCNKVIPEQLYNFRGEFCMSGGSGECPYYQMPDHGRLTVAKGPLADITFFIKEEITTVGKDFANAVALMDSSVSKKHAAIKVDDQNRYEIRDFGSTNGTYVNGEKIQRMFLKDGDKLMFGTVEIEFHLK